MASTRRRSQGLWPEPFESWGDWALRPFESWRRMVEEEQVKVEEFTENGQVVVRAELPGVDPDRDVDISIVDGNLWIRAERRQEEQTEQRNYRRTEIRYGSYSRILPLPPGAREADIQASYHDGILEVRAPIDEKAGSPSRIPIRRT